MSHVVDAAYEQVSAALAGMPVGDARPAAVGEPRVWLAPSTSPYGAVTFGGRRAVGIDVVVMVPLAQPMRTVHRMAADVFERLAAAGLRPGEPEPLIVNDQAALASITVPATVHVLKENPS